MSRSRPRTLLVVLLALSLVLLSSASAMGATKLVKDINRPGHSNPRQMTNVRGVLYFAAGSPRGMLTAPFRSDGTKSGTVPLRDITREDGSVRGDSLSDGFLRPFVAVGRNVYFITNRGLYRTRGTPATTKLVCSGCVASNWVVFRKHLYFVGSRDGVHGLWRTDGTTAGTELVKAGAAAADYLGVVGDRLLIVDGSELWRSDGTTSGTVLVTDDKFTMVFKQGRDHFRQLGGILYFNAGELWRTDGTEAGTYMVRNILPGSAVSNPSLLTRFKGRLYFYAWHKDLGRELWRTDGTKVGTRLVKDVMKGPDSSARGNNRVPMVKAGGQLFFATKGSPRALSHNDLWVTDGTRKGTHRLADGVKPQEIVRLGKRVFFSGGWSDKLWTSDGTRKGTRQFADIWDRGDSDPHQLTTVGGVLFFAATGRRGTELYKHVP